MWRTNTFSQHNLLHLVTIDLYMIHPIYCLVVCISIYFLIKHQFWTNFQLYIWRQDEGTKIYQNKSLCQSKIDLFLYFFTTIRDGKVHEKCELSSLTFICLKCVNSSLTFMNFLWLKNMSYIHSRSLTFMKEFTVKYFHGSKCECKNL